jgi:hypothetical protein
MKKKLAITSKWHLFMMKYRSMPLALLEKKMDAWAGARNKKAV